MTNPSIWGEGDNGKPIVKPQTFIATETFYATEGQTTFTITRFTYTPGTESLRVYVNGTRVTGLQEISTTSFSLPVGCAAKAGAKIYVEAVLEEVAVISGVSYENLADYENAGKGANLVGAQDNSGGSIFTTVQGFITKILSSAGAANVGFIQSGTGAVATDVQEELRIVIRPEQFGAVADGVTSDSDAINRATANAATLASVYKGYVTVLLTPGKSYRVDKHLFARSLVKIEGYGANLIGPITGYERITGSTPVPAASDIVGYTSGGCWTDETPMTSPSDFSGIVNSPMFEGFTMTGFRWGFASRVYAWAYPHMKHITAINCDAFGIAFNGGQMWHIENPSVNNCYSLIIGGATGYASGNPLAGGDIAFFDGLILEGHGQAGLYVVKSNDFDTWFQNAILRPSVTSTTAGFSDTFKLIGGSPTAEMLATVQAPSGRLFYLPQRNNRLTFDCNIRKLHCIGAPRGYGLLTNPQNGEITHIRGEGLFTDAALTSECGVLIGTSNSAQSSCKITGIDTNFVTGTVYDSAIGVWGGSGTVIAAIDASAITGKVNSTYYKHFSRLSSMGDETLPQYELNRHFGVVANSTVVAQNSSQFSRILIGFPERNFDIGTGLSLLKRTISGTIPRVGSTETIMNLIQEIGAVYRGRTEPIQGKLKVFVRRTDTGVQDYGEFLITFCGQNASSTLSIAHNSGNLFIDVVTGVYFGAGTVITVGGTDKYLVKKYSGNRVYLMSALRNSYSSGAAVVGVTAIDTTIRALSGGIASLGTSGPSLQLINSLGNTVPIDYRLEFEYFGAPDQT